MKCNIVLFLFLAGKMKGKKEIAKREKNLNQCLSDRLAQSLQSKT